MPNKDPEKRRAYHREYISKRYANDKEYKKKHLELVQQRKTMLREWLRDYKKQLKCCRCEENHPACLQFHHRDANEKIMDVSAMVRRGQVKEKILDEIGKCDVLCANCHFKEHYKEDEEVT